MENRQKDFLVNLIKRKNNEGGYYTMSRIYNAYLKDKDREYAIESAKEDLQFSRYAVMLNMIDDRLELNRKAAELKVLEESGTYEDLKYLYTEAENEANQQKVGVIQSIVNGIKQAIHAITSAIANATKSTKNPNEIVEVGGVEWDNSNKIINGWNEISSTMNGNPNDQKLFDKVVDKIKKLLPTLGVVGAAAGGTVVASQVIKKVKASERDTNANKLKDILSTVEKFLNNSILTPIANGVDWVINKVKGIVGKNDDKTENNDNNDDDSKKEGIGSQILKWLQDFIKKIRETISGIKIPFKKNSNDSGNSDSSAKNTEPRNSGNGNNESQNANQPNNNQGTNQNEDANTSTGTNESVNDDFYFGLQPDDYYTESSNEDDLESLYQMLEEFE